MLRGPDNAELAEYYARQREDEEDQGKIRSHAAYPAETEDGQRVRVRANIESVGEAANVLSYGGEGVGLVRTEYGYIARSTLPGEDELSAEYAGLAKAMLPHKVTFRTLDVGVDKILVARKVMD